MQRLKPQNLLHKWQKLTKTQRQLTINTKAKSLSDKSNSSQSKASEVGLKQQALWISQRAIWSLWQRSLCGHDGNALTDVNKNTCTLAAKNEIQKRPVDLNYISVQRQRNKMIILRVGGTCFEYYSAFSGREGLSISVIVNFSVTALCALCYFDLQPEHFSGHDCRNSCHKLFT